MKCVFLLHNISAIYTQVESILQEYMDDFGITSEQLLEASTEGMANKHQVNCPLEFLIRFSKMSQIDSTVHVCAPLGKHLEPSNNC